MTNLTLSVRPFQSTLPRGSDRKGYTLLLPRHNFNPRSLAGATLPLSSLIIKSFRFQSTLPRGSDFSHRRNFGEECQFQSTLPRGSDLAFATQLQRRRKFQSTLPRGSDGVYYVVPYLAKQISIHAPSRERPLKSDMVRQCLYFNPHSLAGAT